jgi:hypothetical protein
MKPEEIIRGLPGPPVEEWIAMLPAGTHRERLDFLVERGLASNHARAVLVVGQARRGARGRRR